MPYPTFSKRDRFRLYGYSLEESFHEIGLAETLGLIRTLIDDASKTHGRERISDQFAALLRGLPRKARTIAAIDDARDAARQHTEWVFDRADEAQSAFEDALGPLLNTLDECRSHLERQPPIIDRHLRALVTIHRYPAPSTTRRDLSSIGSLKSTTVEHERRRAKAAINGFRRDHRMFQAVAERGIWINPVRDKTCNMQIVAGHLHILGGCLDDNRGLFAYALHAARRYLHILDELGAEIKANTVHQLYQREIVRLPVWEVVDEALIQRELGSAFRPTKVCAHS